MNRWNMILRVRSLTFMLCFALFAGPIALGQELKGRVIDESGRGISDVKVRMWVRGSLQRDEVVTARDGSYDVTLIPSTDALLLIPPSKFHIGVERIGRERSVTTRLSLVEDQGAEGLSNALRTSQILHEYEKAALLALATDSSVNRRFVMYEFGKSDVLERLSKLQVPDEGDTAEYLREKKGRILETFEMLTGGARRRRSRD